ncbi:hypothetical protein AC578_8813 [Pseudocercospora eumusae]|uniref:GPI anchored cell wall protein n=1 Tax=Pseudocercospora eumusae TaxID=321146 RepID=A0A139GVL3_9PEZI|nr:hypothetical protein AC578_8813 [Pseudocercospora eumusae]
MFFQLLTMAAMAMSATAQTTKPATDSSSGTATATGNVQTTITGLVGSYTTGFAASVVTANACDTVLAMQCTNTENPLCSSASDIEVTVTQGPSQYVIQYSTSSMGAIIAFSESCSLNGPSGSASEAVCTDSLFGSVAGQSTATSGTTTLTNMDDFNYAPIPITAGAEKLPSSGASCTATPTSKAGAAAATSVSEIYKIIVPVGAAVVGAFL